MTEGLKQKARQRAEEIEEKQTLGIYDNDEDWARDEAWNEGYVSGFEDGYISGATENGTQWHKVADGKLPELDKKVWVIRSADDDIPMVARRHIYTSRGYTEWVWECYWGSCFDLEQNEIFAWCEIPPFKE